MRVNVVYEGETYVLQCGSGMQRVSISEPLPPPPPAQTLHFSPANDPVDRPSLPSPPMSEGREGCTNRQVWPCKEEDTSESPPIVLCQHFRRLPFPSAMSFLPSPPAPPNLILVVHPSFVLCQVAWVARVAAQRLGSGGCWCPIDGEVGKPREYIPGRVFYPDGDEMDTVSDTPMIRPARSSPRQCTGSTGGEELMAGRRRRRLRRWWRRRGTRTMRT